MIFFYVIRLNVHLGFGTVSDPFFYLLGSAIGGMDIILNLLPAFIIMAKIANPGIEATMVALTNQIIFFTQFGLRNMIGALVNHTFFGVTTSDIADYHELIVVEFIFKLLPFLYIGILVPTKKQMDDHQISNMHKKI